MPPSKSILIIGSYPPPYGGVPRHLEDLAPTLAAKGWDVHILTSGHSGTKRHNGFTVHKQTRGAKTYRIVTGAVRGDWRSIGRVAFEQDVGSRARWVASLSLGRTIMRRHPVKVISVYNLLRVPVALLLSEEFGVPLVITNFGEPYSDRHVLERRIDVVRRAVERAAVLLAMSRNCADGYRELGITARVTVIPYGIDVRRFSPDGDRGPVRKRLGFAPTDCVVLYVGRMIRDMGMHTILAAIPGVLDAADHVKFLLVGSTGQLLPDAEQLASARPGKVVVISDAPGADLPGLYRAADIVVAPTQGARACGSLASLEAMASGKPVIAAAVGGIPEIVVDGETGILIPPDDPDLWTDAVLQLVHDSGRRALLGARGRERALASFDSVRLNNEIERVFSDIAARAESA